MNRIVKFIVLDIIKNKIVVLYTLLLAAFSWSAFTIEDTSTKGVLTLLNIVLLTVPLVAILFSTIYIYNSAEFIELLTSHPVKRNKIWWSIFIGLSTSFVLSFVLGAGIPLLLFADAQVAGMMILIGSLVSVIFVSIAFLSFISSRDKAKGIGISILLWLYFALLFDGLVLFLLFQLAEYPIERMMVGITAFSPIDLSRILMLLQLDVSAMMGYTGAVFKKFFGTTFGMAIAISILILWIALPFGISLNVFKKKDL